MFKSWRLGRVLGFPVEVNLSFLLLLGVVFLWMGGLAGLFVVGLAFGSVLLHELGHSIVARKLGVPISGIELSFFGGAAKMMDLPRTANHEIQIAAAGPAVSLALAGLGFGLGAIAASPLLALIGWINLIIAAFNLLPALPMDGGRILRALLTRKMTYVAATDAAVQVSRVFAIGFAVYGLMTGALQLVVLAPLLWMMGTRERLVARHVGHRYGYSRDGYGERSGGEPEVLPRGWGFHRQPTGRDAAPRARVVRTHDGRYVIVVGE
jgi:Zn-dependent protease